MRGRPLVCPPSFSRPLVPIQLAHGFCDLPTDAKVDMNTVSKNRFHVLPVRGPPKGDIMRFLRFVEPVKQKGRILLLSARPSGSWYRLAWPDLIGTTVRRPEHERPEHEPSPVLPCTLRRQAHGVVIPYVVLVLPPARAGRGISLPAPVPVLSRTKTHTRVHRRRTVPMTAPEPYSVLSPPIPFDFPTRRCH